MTDVVRHPTMTTAVALESLDRDGYVVLEALIDPPRLAALRDELAPLLRANPLGRNPFEGERTHRVYALLRKAPGMAWLVEHPAILAIVDALLLPNPLLTACQAIELLPGETEQPFHFDDGFYPMPRPRAAISVSTIWALDDFTPENGATEVIPGSHRWADGVVPDPADARLRPVVMPAGSVVVFLGTLWHRGGANRSALPRCGISPQYCEPWARQQEAMILSVGPAAAGLSDRVRALLGYSIHPPFMGFVDGVHPSRLLDVGYDASSSGEGRRSADFWERGGFVGG